MESGIDWGSMGDRERTVLLAELADEGMLEPGGHPVWRDPHAPAMDDGELMAIFTRKREGERP